uniref:Uncharacterized protein n=1 Tax=Caenorhabditis japonica TaxID=281687 RepID=A0A8R1EWJ8_CAEJA
IIKVAVGYKLNGEVLSSPPAQANAWGAIEVEYKEFEGWNEPTVGIRKYEDLPEKCRTYVQFIEDFIKINRRILRNFAEFFSIFCINEQAK